MGEQRWDAGLYDDRHAFVWKHGEALLEWLGAAPGERVLDLGCGTGHLTARLAESGAEVVGLDSSPEMVEQARRAHPGLRFEVGDARDFALGEPFDAVFSNAALHWVKEADQVIARVHTALRPGGRFVAELGGRGNVRALLAGLGQAARRVGVEPPAGRWYFPALGEYASLLERSSCSSWKRRPGRRCTAGGPGTPTTSACACGRGGPTDRGGIRAEAVRGRHQRRPDAPEEDTADHTLGPAKGPVS